MDSLHSLLSRDFAAKLLLAVGLCATGCESLGTTRKFKNPVVPAAPRRVEEDDDLQAGQSRVGIIRGTEEGAEKGPKTGLPRNIAQQQQRGPRGGNPSPRAHRGAVPSGKPAAEEPEEVQQTGGTDRGRLSDWRSVIPAEVGAQPVESGEVAATVNGIPIFVEDVVKQYADKLRQAEKQLSPSEYRKQRRHLIQQLLPQHIERELLVQALRVQLKDEQFEGLSKHLDKQFEEELQSTIKKLKVNTPGELESELRKKGSSIATLRNNFRNERMSQQYLALKAIPKDGFDRPDLLKYYQDHLDRYAVDGEVKWQQISLKFSRHGGKAATAKTATWILAQLDQGADFAELARKYSTGPTAKNGGHWDWTKQGSMTSEIMDVALFELPLGEISAALETPQSLEILRVLDRKDAGYKSFESVQADIKKELKEAEFRKSATQLLADLRAAATIEDLTEQL